MAQTKKYYLNINLVKISTTNFTILRDNMIQVAYRSALYNLNDQTYKQYTYVQTNNSIPTNAYGLYELHFSCLSWVFRLGILFFIVVLFSSGQYKAIISDDPSYIKCVTVFNISIPHYTLCFDSFDFAKYALSETRFLSICLINVTSYLWTIVDQCKCIEIHFD